MSETFSVKADVVSGDNKAYGCSAPVGGVIHCAVGAEVDLDMLRSNGIYPMVFGRQEKREMPRKAKTVVRSSTGIGGKINLYADIADGKGYVGEVKFLMNDIVDVSVIENGGEKKVVVVTFGDGSTQKAVLCDNDEFSLEQGISVCVTKHLLDHGTGHGSSLYNKVIDRGLKVYKNRIKAEETKAREAAEEKARRERKLAKKREKSAKRAAAKREDQINILSAAIQRAFSNINGTSDEAVG